MENVNTALLIDTERKRLQILVGTDKMTPDQARATMKAYKAKICPATTRSPGTNNTAADA